MPRNGLKLLAVIAIGGVIAWSAAGIPWLTPHQQTLAQDPKAKPVSTDNEVVAPIESLAKAYNAADAKAYAAVWTENAEYLDEDTGERMEGRKAIADDFADALGKGPKARLEFEVTKLRRLGANAASVEGTASVLRARTAPSRSKFLVLLVRQDGNWLIDSVRESKLDTDNSNAEMLEPLLWLEGNWSHKEGDREVTLECTDVANGNFRSHRFRVKSKGEIIHEGTQIIGWDSIKKHLRSWVFSSDGSFGEGAIESKGNRLIFRVTGVLPGGSKSTATQIITRKGDRAFTFQATDRSVGTRVLPDVEEITLSKTTAATKEDE